MFRRCLCAGFLFVACALSLAAARASFITSLLSLCIVFLPPFPPLPTHRTASRMPRIAGPSAHFIYLYLARFLSPTFPLHSNPAHDHCSLFCLDNYLPCVFVPVYILPLIWMPIPCPRRDIDLHPSGFQLKIFFQVLHKFRGRWTTMDYTGASLSPGISCSICVVTFTAMRRSAMCPTVA
ncbi:hypothetical protein MSAN_02020900 [Mycena sanguinolenta]|uniref:Secreted peptide n=1 Tax=Mycena sanguinolenta TaxID=230812 RepID=A0A8H7CNL9_9AGAR|nr:hypothetical protein MSAN_02020900 [Mycena sanguinolenta]